MRRQGSTHTRCVNDSIDALDSLIEIAWALKVVNLHKVEVLRILRPGLEHSIALGRSTGGAPDLEAPGQEGVHDVRANKARGSSDENVLAKYHVSWRCLLHTAFGNLTYRTTLC